MPSASNNHTYVNNTLLDQQMPWDSNIYNHELMSKRQDHPGNLAAMIVTDAAKFWSALN